MNDKRILLEIKNKDMVEVLIESLMMYDVQLNHSKNAPRADKRRIINLHRLINNLEKKKQEVWND